MKYSEVGTGICDFWLKELVCFSQSMGDQSIQGSNWQIFHVLSKDPPFLPVLDNMMVPLLLTWVIVCGPEYLSVLCLQLGASVIKTWLPIPNWCGKHLAFSFLLLWWICFCFYSFKYSQSAWKLMFRKASWLKSSCDSVALFVVWTVLMTAWQTALRTQTQQKSGSKSCLPQILRDRTMLWTVW